MKENMKERILNWKEGWKIKKIKNIGWEREREREWERERKEKWKQEDWLEKKGEKERNKEKRI